MPLTLLASEVYTDWRSTLIGGSPTNVKYGTPETPMFAFPISVFTVENKLREVLRELIK